MAFNNSLTIGSATYERLDNGKWILNSSTADEPTYFELKANPRQSTASDYVVKYTRFKNSTVPGAADDTLVAYIVVRGSLKAFTQSEIEAAIGVLTGFAVTANITKLLRGET